MLPPNVTGARATGQSRSCVLFDILRALGVKRPLNGPGRCVLQLHFSLSISPHCRLLQIPPSFFLPLSLSFSIRSRRLTHFKCRTVTESAAEGSGAELRRRSRAINLSLIDFARTRDSRLRISHDASDAYIKEISFGNVTRFVLSISGEKEKQNDQLACITVRAKFSNAAKYGDNFRTSDCTLNSLCKR